MFGDDGLDVAQVEQVAQVVRRGVAGQGLPDVVFAVGEQRVEGGEQSPVLPVVLGAGEGVAQVGEGEFVGAGGDAALFDGGEAVELCLAVAVVVAAQEAVLPVALVGLFDGGEQVGEGAGDGAAKDAAVVVEFAVDVACVQFGLQFGEAVVAAGEDLDVAGADAGEAAVGVTLCPGAVGGEEAGDEGGDGVGFFAVVGAAVVPLHRPGDGVAAGADDGGGGVGGLGAVVGDVLAEAGVVALEVVFVQRGDEVGAATAVGVEAVLFGGGEVLFEAVVVGDVAATEGVDGLFGVADEEEEGAGAIGVVAQPGVFEQGRLFVVEVL